MPFRTSFDKRSRNSVIIKLRTGSGDTWSFDGFTRLAKRTQKFLSRAKKVQT